MKMEIGLVFFARLGLVIAGRVKAPNRSLRVVQEPRQRRGYSCKMETSSGPQGNWRLERRRLQGYSIAKGEAATARQALRCENPTRASGPGREPESRVESRQRGAAGGPAGGARRRPAAALTGLFALRGHRVRGRFDAVGQTATSMPARTIGRA